MSTCHCPQQNSTHTKPVHVAFCGSIKIKLILAFTMDLSLHTVLLITATFSVLVEEGFGLPLFQASETQSSSSTAARVRTKRCSCSNWMDTECIYFCHLDIIWVNTPSKIVPYGLGSPLSRRRRSTGRCECANPDDPTCSTFCHASSMDPSLVIVSPLDPKVGRVDKADKVLLKYFRQVARSNLFAAERSSASRKN